LPKPPRYTLESAEYYLVRIGILVLTAIAFFKLIAGELRSLF